MKVFCNYERFRKRVYRRGTSGFTLLELLVVIAIILLLLALLMPSLRAVRRQSLRVACANNVRQLLAATLLMTAQERGIYPRLHSGNGSPYWFSVSARNRLTGDYGLERGMFYCPSNMERWNRDDFWTWPGGQHSVWGYAYVADDGALTWTKIWPPEWDPNRPFHSRRLSDQPHITILWSDLLRQWQGFGWFGPDERQGANHLYGIDPDGANQGFKDGSVRWTPFSAIQARFRSGDFRLFL